MKINWVGGMVLVGCLASAATCQAWWWTKRHPDRNRDGVVTPREIQIDKAQDAAKRVVNTPWEAAMDKNRDGFVEMAEMRGYYIGIMDANRDGIIQPRERVGYWNAHPCVVNTAEERKYDLNRDGFLQWAESVEMIKDRIRVFSMGGKAIVNSPIEAQFDWDHDGILSPREVDTMRDVLK